jgi:hypothetical protein
MLGVSINLIHYQSPNGAISCNTACVLTGISFGCSDERGCAYCGGLGHRITDCPKLEAKQIKETGNIGRKDYLAPGAADW